MERHNTRWFNQQLEEIGALSPPYPWQEDEEEELDIYVEQATPKILPARKRVVHLVADLGRDDCAVCLAKLLGAEPSLKLAVVECGHVFHQACLLEVKDSRCPLCRLETGREKRRRTDS